MIRTYTTHLVRPQQELTGRLWEFSPCQGEFAGKTYQVPTPSCWETYPDFGNYRGEGIYKTTFAAQGNIRLEFKGISHTATVYLDGEKIASHYNAFTMFDTVVKALPAGEHTLTIRVDNSFGPDSALHVPNDYMTYGGINRPAALEILKDAYIEWVHVTPHFDGCWHADVEVKVKNISDTPFCGNIRAEIEGNTYEWTDCSIPADSSELFRTAMTFENVTSWTPKTPVLYTVNTALLQNGIVTDDLIDRFGFRQVSIEGKKILLNGEPLRIKGFCRHEDHPQFGCALPFEAIAADLAIIRHLGGNSVRTSHYPNDEIFLDLCDEQGILVWEENHARGLSLENMQNPNFEPQAEQVILEMITAHYNHPCIYIWGILNECASDTEYGRECYRKQFELIQKLDCSRPRSFSSCRYKTDISLDLPDVVSYNIYPQWYHNSPVLETLDDLYQWVQQESGGAGKPFLVTEIGAGGIYGYRNNYNSKWTEDYQAQAIDKQLSTVLHYEDCCGVYIWQFCDVRVSDEWFSGRPRTMNNKGIVDEYRRRKLCYEVVKKHFTAED